jgi:undecaprenyl-diphosphatase
MLHVGTLIPIFVVFYKQILDLFKKPWNKMIFLIIATIPAMITGLLLSDFVEGAFYGGTLLSAILLSLTFLPTAGELLLSEKRSKLSKSSLPLSYKSSIMQGVAQGIAIVPGLSRSGTVISAGCMAGLDRSENANFTFLMSIPVILGAALVSSIDVIKSGVEIDLVPVLFGVITAMITGYIAIKVMLRVIKKANYKWFSLYLVVMAIASTLSFVAFGA